MMIVIKALLLFLLCDSAFSQDPCADALAQLNADSDCQQAYLQVSNATDSENTTDSANATLSALQEYCSPSCRAIVENIAMKCVSGI